MIGSMLTAVLVNKGNLKHLLSLIRKVFLFIFCPFPISTSIMDNLIVRKRKGLLSLNIIDEI